MITLQKVVQVLDGSRCTIVPQKRVDVMRVTRNPLWTAVIWVPAQRAQAVGRRAGVICVVVRTEMLVVVRAVAVGELIIVSPQLGV